MTREDILCKLHSIRIGARPTVITYDMGLQYEYVTPEGHGEGFGNMGAWPTYCLKNIPNGIFEVIKQKIKDGVLTLDDLAGTDLQLFYNHVFDIPRPESCIPDICDFFQRLLPVLLGPDGKLFVMCDACQWEPEAYFYSTYEELEETFADYYASDIEAWEDLDDEELEEWLHRTEDELDSIPFVVLREEEDDE